MERVTRMVTLLLLGTILTSSGIVAGELPSMFGDRGDELVLWPLSGRPQVVEAVAVGEAPAVEERAAGGPDRSPRRAFIMSLLLPGSGQFYAESRTKAAVYLGLEAVAVGLWYAWRSEGNDLEDQFRAMADRHWEPEEYMVWINRHGGSGQVPITHALPCSMYIDEYRQTGSFGDCSSAEVQQYYELIGKYHQFVAGWDDLQDRDTGNPIHNRAQDVDFRSYDPDLHTLDAFVDSVYHSPRRIEYEDLRHDSNRYLKRARHVSGLIMVNHIISAVDAARTAQARSAGVEEAVIERRTRVRVGMQPGVEGTVPMIFALKRFD